MCKWYYLVGVSRLKHTNILLSNVSIIITSLCHLGVVVCSGQVVITLEK